MGKLTIADIAARAGVSKATVSRVLNDRAEGVGAETRARIRAILETTGFQPSAMARGLATGESRSVGLIVPDVTNPFHPLLVSGAEQALNDAGYSLFLCNTGSDAAKQGDYIRVLIDKRVDGVILNSVGFEAEAQVRLLEREGIPVVLLDCVIGRRAQRHGVFLDNGHGVREAMAFLFRRPDRRLVFISGPADVSQSVDRRESVEALASEWGLDGGRLTTLDGDFTLERGCQLTTERIRSCRARASAALQCGVRRQRHDGARSAEGVAAGGRVRSGRGRGDGLRRHPIRSPARSAAVDRSPAGARNGGGERRAAAAAHRRRKAAP